MGYENVVRLVANVDGYGMGGGEMEGGMKGLMDCLGKKEKDRESNRGGEKGEAPFLPFMRFAVR
jgi:hypothetical protein